MEIHWDDLKINFDHIEVNRLTESWDWLIGKDKTPILMSSIGDLFLSDQEENCFWLNVGAATIEKVANSIIEFENKLKNIEQVDEWFLIELVQEIKEKGLELNQKNLYSFKILPTLGGKYEPGNFELADIEVHFELNGQIQKQIKNLPEGTKIGKFKFE